MREVARREAGRHPADRDAEAHLIRAAARAREALGAFISVLPEGTGPLGVMARQLRADPALAAAREVWRAAHRDAMAARDDAAGL